jgi:hypothetical protein
VSQPELLLAAAWPRETLQRMAHEPSSPIASERLYASLMHRRDILAELNGLILGSSTLIRAALRDLTLRHAPAKIVDARNAVAVAEHVACWTRPF